jgi:DNA (cytosine-5)-methyltransferase 1
MNTIEICAGAGGQALGLHQAGFEHIALIEIDSHACRTLKHNNQRLNLGWGEIVEGDVKDFAKTRAREFHQRVDLLAGGVPCPPFSKAGKKLGPDDDRDLFPTALELVDIIRPRAVMLENVAGLTEDKFAFYLQSIRDRLHELGYQTDWRVLNACDFGVPQLRPRFILVAALDVIWPHFKWPTIHSERPPSVGEILLDLIRSNGWEGAEAWCQQATGIAPTLVGGSKKHGGPDLGPARAKAAWQRLGVNAHRLGNDDEVPGPGFRGALMRNGSIKEGFANMPLLNVRMAARIQGFPDEWEFVGTKTHTYRQVGNAFPPPVARAVGLQIMAALEEFDQLLQVA